MSDWKEYTVSDLLQIEYGKSLKNYRSGIGKYEVFGTNGKIGLTDEYLFNEPSIIIGRKGAYREVHLAQKPFFVIDTAFYTKKKNDKTDTTFMYYWFKNIDINAMDSGSAIPSTSRDELYELQINLPSLPEQIIIAEILNCFDNKIDLLHRQNATLEALGVTLFKHQISNADFLEADTLGNLFNVSIGRTPPRKEPQWFTFNPSDIKWISIKDMGNAGVYIDKTSEYLTKEAVVRFNVPIIPTNTVLLSFKLTLGRVAITTENMLSNEAIAHLKIKDGSKFYPEFVYLFLKSFNYSSLGSTSSIAEAINSQMIKQIEMPVPDDETLNSLKEQVMPLFKKMKSNSKQLKTLTQLKDTLLPKLMSGEVRVESEQEEMADV